MSTIYQFLGILKDEENNAVNPLILDSTKYLPSLGGKIWEDPLDDDNSLTQDIRLIIKRSKIQASIILKESDENAKYDLFQRLNTGGSDLSPQEVRNCILVMFNKELFLWLQDLAKFEPFQECISLSDRPLSESYDCELALRFIIFSLIAADELASLGDVGIFITDKMSEIATDENFSREFWEDLFKSTFDMLANEMGESSFKRFSTGKQKFLGGFLLSQFEVLAYGIAFNLNEGKIITEITNKAAEIWSNPRYTDWSGSGITATRRLPRIIPFGREVFGNGN